MSYVICHHVIHSKPYMSQLISCFNSIVIMLFSQGASSSYPYISSYYIILCTPLVHVIIILNTSYVIICMSPYHPHYMYLLCPFEIMSEVHHVSYPPYASCVIMSLPVIITSSPIRIRCLKVVSTKHIPVPSSTLNRQ